MTDTPDALTKMLNELKTRRRLPDPSRQILVEVLEAVQRYAPPWRYVQLQDLHDQLNDIAEKVVGPEPFDVGSIVGCCKPKAGMPLPEVTQRMMRGHASDEVVEPESEVGGG